MPEQAQRVRIEQADWLALLPFLHLFKGFRMAIQPSKMALAMMLVLLTYLGGLGLDFMWGPHVYEGEVERYLTLTSDRYDLWRTSMDQSAERAQRFSEPIKRFGIFEATLHAELAAFKQFVSSATNLNFGISAFLSGRGLASGGVIGALGIMVVGIPAWLFVSYPGFLAVFLVYAFLLTALFGGAISRLAALHACRGVQGSAAAGLRFTGQRYVWFVLSPIIPLGVALVIGIFMAAVGLLFNLPVLDIVGSVLFGLLLFAGLAIAVILIALLVGANLLFPALATEGTDAFDAITRAFNYVLGRPWQYLFYNGVMSVYGAITYLFVGLIVFSTLWATKVFTGWWVFRAAGEDARYFDTILPDPQLGDLLYTVNWDALGSTGTIAAAIIMVWVKLLIAILPAYAVSLYFCEQTWIYLLLRRSADRSELDEVHLEPGEDEEEGLLPEKLEPIAAAMGTSDEGDGGAGEPAESENPTG